MFVIVTATDTWELVKGHIQAIFILRKKGLKESVPGVPRALLNRGASVHLHWHMTGTQSNLSGTLVYSLALSEVTS
jgi:hypothetical protein